MEGHKASIMPTEDAQTVINIYRRVLEKKFVFATADDAPARYFLKNPVPAKHASMWKPLFYRGDNPKYSPESIIIGRARRTAIWSSVNIELGDGVQQIVDNRIRAKARRKQERKKKWRRRFWMKEKPPKEEIGDDVEVTGLVVPMSLWRNGVCREMRWNLGDVEYRWTGTRQMSKRKMKGISHDLKLTRTSDNVVLATFSKKFFQSSIKTGSPPNKKKTPIGILQIYPSAYINPAHHPDAYPPDSNSIYPTDTTPLSSGIKTAAKYLNNDKLMGGESVNPTGAVTNDLIEQSIVFTCWATVEGEHRLRYKILDILQEIGESVDG